MQLNLSFVKLNQDFDGSLGWYNETNSSDPLKILAGNQIDYITVNISNDFITEKTWNPNLYELTTDLRGDYRIGFVTKKKTDNFNIRLL